MGRRSDLTAEERSEVGLALLRLEKPVSVLAKRYGVRKTSLGRWWDDFIAAGTQGLGPGKRQPPGPRHQAERLKAEVAERDRVIGELTTANHILKRNSLPRGLTPVFAGFCDGYWPGWQGLG